MKKVRCVCGSDRLLTLHVEDNLFKTSCENCGLEASGNSPSACYNRFKENYCVGKDSKILLADNIKMHTKSVLHINKYIKFPKAFLPTVTLDVINNKRYYTIVSQDGTISVKASKIFDAIKEWNDKTTSDYFEIDNLINGSTVLVVRTDNTVMIIYNDYCYAVEEFKRIIDNTISGSKERREFNIIKRMVKLKFDIDI